MNTTMQEDKTLINKTEIQVRFSEVDSMKVVWHGHYLKYFEDGREAFGLQYGVGYMDFYDHDIYVPLVKIEVNFKRSLHSGEKAIVETRYIRSKAAKLEFAYVIKSCRTQEVVATGHSVQVFLDINRDLLLNAPRFYEDWKQKWGLS